MRCDGSWILGATGVTLLAAAISMKLARRFRKPLFEGDRIRVYGGHQDPPAWLNGKRAVTGRITRFIPGDPGTLAAEVTLDEPLVLDDVSHSYLVLRLRYRDARWTRREAVHVEAWEERPSQTLPTSGAAAAHWVESHATYEVMR